MNYSKNKMSISKIVVIITAIILIIILFLILFLNIRIYKINGTSMSPTLIEDEYVLSYKSFYNRGDIIAFHYKDNVMIKRIIGLPNDIIDIDEDGNIYINDELLNEPYLPNKAKGDIEITLPYKVPSNKYFVLGDNRADSLDSRNIHISSISENDIIGTVKVSLIPLKKIS